jgi:hypothetical protein
MSLLKSTDSHITFLEFSNVFLLLNVGSKVLHSYRASRASGSHGVFYICDIGDRIAHVSHSIALHLLLCQRKADLNAILQKESLSVAPPDGKYRMAGGGIRGGGIQLNRPASGIKPTASGSVYKPLAPTLRGLFQRIGVLKSYPLSLPPPCSPSRQAKSLRHPRLSHQLKIYRKPRFCSADQGILM